ncbi:MAG: hypothetical protein AB8F74_06625 [Saprospiraceae bacterium]
MKNTFVIISILLTSFSLSAQEWKKMSKKADKLYKQAQYEEAASLYESAWEKKRSKTNLMYKAGEAYYEMRDFRRATQAFGKVKDATGKSGLAGLKYARSLKQNGEYEKAKEELVYYIKRYKEKDKKVVAKIVQMEIEGCELALQLGSEKPENVLIEYLSENINTLEDEFAPVPFSDDILYFSSTVGDKVNMYRSQRQSGVWTPAVVPDLPKVGKGVICNGTFAPDNSRFYFTICEAEGKWKGAETACDIYMTKRVNQEWSAPQKLHDYIKDDGKTATQPYVVHQGDEEILFFVSDRDGGFGGLDIWYTKRQIKADDIDFTLPKNAGPMVNTMGDELTPYYNDLKEALFFSSNGHPSIGGFDIFESSDKGDYFGQSVNLGTPINSANDDFFYKEENNGNGGFLVSNRLFGLEKITSTHDDIFYFSTPREQIVISGTVLNEETKQPMENVVASLFEIKSNNRKRLLQAKTFPKGSYEFILLPNKDYSLIVEREGFGSSKYNFTTFHHDSISEYTRDFSLQAGQDLVANATVSRVNNSPQPTKRKSVSTTPSKTTKPKTTTTHNRTYTSTRKPATSTDNTNSVAATKPKVSTPTKKKTYPKRKVTSSAPVYDGVYYKVQLTVVITFNPNQSQFRDVKNMGRLDTEFLPAKKWNRVLLAEFFTIDEAHRAMVKAQQLGFFDAFLVKYRDGKRVTP